MERSPQEVYELGTVDENKLCEVARLVGRMLRGGEMIFLAGDLGSGKTRFVKCMAGAMGIEETLVRSPSFTIINVYPAQRLTLFHADLFRLDSKEEAWDTGLMELLDERSVLAIEWPELVVNELRERVTITVELGFVSFSHRSMKITISGELSDMRKSLYRYLERFSGG